jgi:hypothetical protein
MHDNVVAEEAQCHCTFMYAISAIVGHFSPDFASVNYSMRRLRISNKTYLRNLVGKPGYGPERLMCTCDRTQCQCDARVRNDYSSRFRTVCALRN